MPNRKGSNGRNSPWTPERTETLKQLWAEGHSAQKIADSLNATRTGRWLSRCAIIGKIHRLGLPERPRKPPKPHPERTARPALVRYKRQETPYERCVTELKAVAEALPSIVPVEIPRGERVTIATLNERTCRWPIGDTKRPDFHFCGHTPATGRPYCPGHCRVAYQTVLERRRFIAQMKAMRPYVEAAE